jgi:hypothetical protein
MDALEVLQAIARSGAAMSALADPSCAVAGAEPPEFNPDGTLKMVDADGNPAPWPLPEDGFDFEGYHAKNPGHPTITLADWVREVTDNG